VLVVRGSVADVLLRAGEHAAQWWPAWRWCHHRRSRAVRGSRLLDEPAAEDGQLLPESPSPAGGIARDPTSSCPAGMSPLPRVDRPRLRVDPRPGCPAQAGAGEEIIIFCSRPPLVLAFDDRCRGHSGAHRLPTWMRLALRPRDRSEGLRCLAGHSATPRGRLTRVHRVDTMWHGRHVIRANSGSSGTTQHPSRARHRPGRNGDGRTDRTLPQPRRAGPHPGPGRTAGQRGVVSRQVNAGRTATGQRRRRVPAKPP
jgi:hypothetical protein